MMKNRMIVLLALTVLVCCLAGCQAKPVLPADNGGANTQTQVSLADEMAAVRRSADELHNSLEKDALTQADMNQKSEALRVLWDNALNRLLDEAKRTLTEAELAKLTAEQTAWEADRSAAIEAAGQAYADGSMYATVVNLEAARLTEERVNELYERLK